MSFVQGKGFVHDAGGSVTPAALVTAAEGMTSGQEAAFRGAVNAAELANSTLRLPRLLSRFQTSGLINPSFLLVGDSVAEGKTYAFFDELARRWSRVQSYAGWVNTATPANGATTSLTDFATWPTGIHHVIPAGGTVEFKEGSLLQWRANQARIYYIREPGAGSFKVQASYNDGAYADVTGTISASAASVSTAVETITLPLGLNSVQVVGVSGTVRIPPIMRYQETGAPGAQMSTLHRGGITVQQLSATPTAITNPVIADIAPDVIVMEVKDALADLQAGLATLVSKINGALGYRPDWVFLGTNQIPGDNADRIAANSFMRSYAETNGYAFLDLSFLFGPTIAAAQTAGLQGAGSDVHPTPAGYTAQVSYIFSQLAEATYGGAFQAQTRPTSIVIPNNSVSVANEWRSRVLNESRFRRVDPGAATYSATASVAAALNANGCSQFQIFGSPAIGSFARAVLAESINSGLGTGSGTRYNVPVGFSIRLAQIVRAQTTFRVFIGAANQHNLTGRGFGIQINSDSTAQLLAHDGTTLTTGPAFSVSNFAQDFQLIIETDGGRVFAYYVVGGSPIPVNPVSTITGGPTGTAPDPHMRLCAAMECIATPLPVQSIVQLFSATVWHGARLVA